MLKILSVENYAITKWVMMVYQVIMNEVCLMHILAFKCANEQYMEYRIRNIEVLFSWYMEMHNHSNEIYSSVSEQCFWLRKNIICRVNRVNWRSFTVLCEAKQRICVLGTSQFGARLSEREERMTRMKVKEKWQSVPKENKAY